MSTPESPKQATPKGDLLAQLLGCNQPKSEREWAGLHEIERLRARVAELEATALSDDGAGDEGMKLHLDNRALRAEVERLKTVPMKYRRMAFNAELQDENVKLRAEIERLTKCLKFEQHYLGRVGTHGPNCHQWGPAHYQCAMVAIEQNKRLITQLEGNALHQAGEIAKHLNEIERLKADAARYPDAARYRWVAKNFKVLSNGEYGLNLPFKPAVDILECGGYCSQIDAAIDAAMPGTPTESAWSHNRARAEIAKATGESPCMKKPNDAADWSAA